MFLQWLFASFFKLKLKLIRKLKFWKRLCIHMYWNHYAKSDDLSKNPDLLQHCLGGMWKGGTFRYLKSSLHSLGRKRERECRCQSREYGCEISLATHRQCNSKMTRASRKQHDQTDTAHGGEKVRGLYRALNRWKHRRSPVDGVWRDSTVRHLHLECFACL